MSRQTFNATELQRLIQRKTSHIPDLEIEIESDLRQPPRRPPDEVGGFFRRAPVPIAIVLEIGPNAYLDEVLATLAHELGHHEQWLKRGRTIDFIFNEIDAWRRGFKWAQRWGIENCYFKHLRRTVFYDPEHLGFELPWVLVDNMFTRTKEDVDRIVTTIKKQMGLGV